MSGIDIEQMEKAPPGTHEYLIAWHKSWLMFEYRQTIQRAKELEAQAVALGLVKRPKLVKR